MSKAKLHELLAVESSLSATAGKLVKESVKAFQKDNLFTGEVKTHFIFDSEKAHLIKAPEVRDVTTTVMANLEYMFNNGLVPYWDAVAQKDEANQRAKADVTIGGRVILKDVPGTTLLGLESKLAELINVLNSVPTLPPGITWVQDLQQAEGVFVNTQKTERTIIVRVPDFKVMYEATKEHKAQIKEFEREESVGKYELVSYNSMISPVKKAAIMIRLQKLVSAVKQARQRANCVEIKPQQIGNDLAAYLLGTD
jgi:hypothetical protein